MNSDLKLIKKKYGEEMSHLCRELFPIILEQEGLLSKLLLDNFEPSHFLYEDIVKNGVVNSFKNYIYSFIDVEIEKEVRVDKNPKELLSEAGYDLYECHSESDIQKFKEYYTSREALCTFRGGRLKNCYVFFAVKKNVDQIRRGNFNHPKRQDEYGTSVISIQFTRDETHTLSIKNRYNHRVENPDATFSNNLDNIIPGLTDSFSKYYGLEQKNKNSKFEIPGYVRANDGKYYPYNMEIDNVYFCPNNIIIDNFCVKKYDKDKYLLFEYFLLNLETKEFIVDYQDDGFLDLCSSIKKLEIEKQELNKIVRIYDQESGLTEIKLNKKNVIISLKNEEVQIISNDFLLYSEDVEDIVLSNAIYIGYRFMWQNNRLKKVFFPNVEIIKGDFLSWNESVEVVILPKAWIIGDNFLELNEELNFILIPKASFIGNYFLNYNNKLIDISLPEAEEVRDYFLENNKSLKTISLPKAKTIGNGFMSSNNKIKKVFFPLAEKIGDYFLRSNCVTEEVILPRAEFIGTNFLEENQKLKRFVVSKELEEEIWNRLNPDSDYIVVYHDGAKEIENRLRQLIKQKR